VELAFKSPSNVDDHVQRVPLDLRVGELKALLSVNHPLRPAAIVQRLIFAGRILNDDERLDNVLPAETYDRSVRHTVHLVLRPLSTTSNSSSAIPMAPQSSYVGLGAYGSYGGSPLVAGVPFGAAGRPNFVPYPYAAAAGGGGGGGGGHAPFVPPAHHDLGGGGGAAVGGAPPHLRAAGPAVIAARVIQIDFSLLLKLAFGVYLLSQGGGEQRLAFLIACAIAIYIYMAGVGRRVELDENGNPVDPPPAAPQQVANNDNNNANQNNNNNDNNPAQARAAAVDALPFWAREERGGFVSQLSAFFIPIILSVNPHWHLPDLSVRDAPPPPPLRETQLPPPPPAAVVRDAAEVQ